MLTELPELLYDVEIDAKDWPVVKITTPEKVDDDNLKGFLDDFNGYIKDKKERFALIMDARKTSGMTPRQRRIQTDAMNNAETNQYYICSALVFKSKTLSRVLTAVLWLKKSEYPVKVFSSVEEAHEWVKMQL